MIQSSRKSLLCILLTLGLGGCAAAPAGSNEHTGTSTSAYTGEDEGSPPAETDPSGDSSTDSSVGQTPPEDGTWPYPPTVVIELPLPWQPNYPEPIQYDPDYPVSQTQPTVIRDYGDGHYVIEVYGDGWDEPTRVCRTDGGGEMICKDGPFPEYPSFDCEFAIQNGENLPDGCMPE